MDDEDLRGSRSNPVVAMETELGRILERYSDVTEARPGWVAALLVEYADTLRDLHDLEHDVEDLGSDVYLVRFNDMTGWVGAPREGDYGDVDAEALGELLDVDVTDNGLSRESVDLDREAGRDE